MQRKLKFSSSVKLPALLSVEGLLLGLLLCLTAAPVQAQSNNSWSSPVNISAQMNDAWFPDIAVDSQGTAHVVFLGSDFYASKDESIKNKYDMDFYQAFSPAGKPLFPEPVNIAATPYGWVARASLAVDNKRGMLQMLYRSKNSLAYQAAPIDKAFSAQNWSKPRNLDDNGTTYYSDVAVDPKGVIHAAWTQVVGKDVASLHQAIMYRSSADQGVTWSFPREIVEPKYGTTRVVLKVDAGGNLHLSWDDGYDNQTARFTSALGGYSHSLDGGATWSTPFNFGSSSSPVVQTVSTPFGTSGVMLAWRGIKDQSIGYMVSQDRGDTWSNPATVPGITARTFSGQHQFDRYYLAADNNGGVHMAAVGQTVNLEKGLPEKEGELGVYHMVWENGKWSALELVSKGTGYVEYPRIGIGPDRLHFVWFERNKPLDETAKAVWYSSRPYVTGIKAQPIVTAPPPPSTASLTQAPAPAPTPQPILPPLEQTTSTTWMSEAYAGALLALLPVLALALLLSAGMWFLKRRNR